jgi:hypothetical protein
VALARAAGLTLGSVEAVRVLLPDHERFGPNRYCFRRRARLRCRVPGFATAVARVTFATAETSTVAPSGQAIVASGSATARVRPERETNPMIRAALRRAQLEADPIALEAARRNAAGAARAAGLRPGSLFAVAEEPRPPFSQDIASGTYGPGQFCGTIRRRRVSRDPVTGERRLVLGPRVRRCYVPGVSSVLRVTLAARPADRPGS